MFARLLPLQLLYFLFFRFIFNFSAEICANRPRRSTAGATPSSPPPAPADFLEMTTSPLVLVLLLPEMERSTTSVDPVWSVSTFLDAIASLGVGVTVTQEC